MNKKLSHAYLFGLLGICSTQAIAFDVKQVGQLSQTEFKALGEDLSAMMSYKPMIPAADLGITGFDVGVSVNGTKISNKEALKEAAGGASIPTVIPMVAVRAAKGLPLGINIGASYSNLPGTPFSAVGGELRWAALPGSVVMPAVSLRLSMSKSVGIDELSTKSTGFDVSVSKGFTLLTPYAGIGRVSTKVKASGTNLSEESIGQTKLFGGLNANLGLMNLAVEADRTGSTNTYGMKLGVRF